MLNDLVLKMHSGVLKNDLENMLNDTVLKVHSEALKNDLENKRDKQNRLHLRLPSKHTNKNKSSRTRARTVVCSVLLSKVNRQNCDSIIRGSRFLCARTLTMKSCTPDWNRSACSFS